MKIAGKCNILNYQYPLWLIQYPVLIRLVFVLNNYVQLRKWTILSVWKKTLKKLPKNFIAIDIGAGESQYLIPFCNRYSKSQFWAIDKEPQSVSFNKNYPCNNLYSEQIDIEFEKIEIRADVLLCVGVLQYIEKDVQALQNMHAALKKDATCLVYVPINGKQITGFFNWVSKRYPNYEHIHNRQRIYSETELIDKLKNTGFEPISKKYTYGFWGILSHEISTGLYLLLIHGNLLIKSMATLAIVLFIPINIICMVLDYITPKKQGNGLLVTAKTIKGT